MKAWLGKEGNEINVQSHDQTQQTVVFKQKGAVKKMHAFEAHFHSDRHQFNQKSRRAASHIELKVAEISVGSSYHGGFQLLDLIITELKSHMTCYISMPLIG